MDGRVSMGRRLGLGPLAVTLTLTLTVVVALALRVGCSISFTLPLRPKLVTAVAAGWCCRGGRRVAHRRQLHWQPEWRGRLSLRWRRHSSGRGSRGGLGWCGLIDHAGPSSSNRLALIPKWRRQRRRSRVTRGLHQRDTDFSQYIAQRALQLPQYKKLLHATSYEQAPSVRRGAQNTTVILGIRWSWLVFKPRLRLQTAASCF